MNIRSHVPRADTECGIVAVDDEAVARARRAIGPDEVVQAVADLFVALADPSRARILWALAECELCVCDIAATVEMSQSAVSHQLRTLRDRSLVAYRRDGKRAVYRLADGHVRALLAQALEHVAEERS